MIKEYVDLLQKYTENASERVNEKHLRKPVLAVWFRNRKCDNNEDACVDDSLIKFFEQMKAEHRKISIFYGPKK